MKLDLPYKLGMQTQSSTLKIRLRYMKVKSPLEVAQDYQDTVQQLEIRH